MLGALCELELRRYWVESDQIAFATLSTDVWNFFEGNAMNVLLELKLREGCRVPRLHLPFRL
jgi:hypothetical protein